MRWRKKSGRVRSLLLIVESRKMWSGSLFIGNKLKPIGPIRIKSKLQRMKLIRFWTKGRILHVEPPSLCKRQGIPALSLSRKILQGHFKDTPLTRSCDSWPFPANSQIFYGENKTGWIHVSNEGLGLLLSAPDTAPPSWLLPNCFQSSENLFLALK